MDCLHRADGFSALTVATVAWTNAQFLEKRCCICAPASLYRHFLPARPSSSGQDTALSRREQGFDSPWAYQINPLKMLIYLETASCAANFSLPISLLTRVPIAGMHLATESLLW